MPDQVYVLLSYTEDYHVVNDEGDVIGHQPTEIEGIYATEPAAYAAQKQAEEEDAKTVQEFDCDPKSFYIKSYTVKT